MPLISHMSHNDIAKALFQGFVDAIFEKPVAVLLFFYSISTCIIMGLCTVNRMKDNQVHDNSSMNADYADLATSMDEGSV